MAKLSFFELSAHHSFVEKVEKSLEFFKSLSKSDLKFLQDCMSTVATILAMKKTTPLFLGGLNFNFITRSLIRVGQKLRYGKVYTLDPVKYLEERFEKVITLHKAYAVILTAKQQEEVGEFSLSTMLQIVDENKTMFHKEDDMSSGNVVVNEPFFNMNNLFHMWKGDTSYLKDLNLIRITNKKAAEVADVAA